MIGITTYDEFQRFITAFARGRINMLVVCSRGGLGKSEEVRRTVGHADVVYVGGHVTPLGLYELLFKGRDRLVLFDEIDGLLGDPKHVGLLKQLCETRTTKRIQWASKDRRAEEIDGGVGHFETRSHVLILCNSFNTLNANISALNTRATVVNFDPPSDEIAAKIASFAADDEIIEFICDFKDCIIDLSLRTYVKLAELKAAGLDWRRYALQEADVPPKVIEIATLLEQFETDLDRVKRYAGSRRDYYNWKPLAEAYLRREQARQRGGAALHTT